MFARNVYVCGDYWDCQFTLFPRRPSLARRASSMGRRRAVPPPCSAAAAELLLIKVGGIFPSFRSPPGASLPPLLSVKGVRGIDPNAPFVDPSVDPKLPPIPPPPPSAASRRGSPNIAPKRRFCRSKKERGHGRGGAKEGGEGGGG